MKTLGSCYRLGFLLFAATLASLTSGRVAAQDTTQIVWAGSLSGSQTASIDFTAGCALEAFDITLEFEAPGSNWPGDMALAITAPNGNRIEVGGYNVDFGYVEAGGWPPSWNTSADGTYSASITNLDGYGLSGSGCWLVEVMNAWNSGGLSDYGMTLDLIGPCADGDNPGCTDPAALNYDACAMADDGSCNYPELSAGFNWASNCGLPLTAQFSDLSIGNVVSYAWTFEGGTPATSTASSPVVTWADTGTYEVTLTVGDGAGSTSINMASLDVSENLHRLEIDITPDSFPQETSFAVTNEEGDTLYSGGAEGLDVCVPSGCLSVWLFDAGADGFSIGGTYQIRYDGSILRDGEHFDAAQLTLTGCPEGSGCDAPIVLDISPEGGVQQLTAPLNDTWYYLPVDTTGQYRFSTCGLTTCDTRIHLYDYCDMAVFETSSEAFITMSDDDCGVQSEVTPVLIAGETIYIRVEGDGDCNSGAGGIPFEVEYLGGVLGCMNIEACNYLPIATAPDTCYLAGDPECPNIGPDLIINGLRAYSTLEMTTESNSDACMIAEGCIQGYGTREIVRFDTEIANIGTEDYFIGAPSAQPDQFEWDACHNHHHYEGYAEYALFDDSGSPLPTIGFKNGFCVLDLGGCNYGGGPQKYTCSNMGITAGCQDIYSRYLDCQWVDITDLPGGDYTLVIRVNWDYSPDANGSYELNYANNAVAVCFSFERDGNGQAVNFEKYDDCDVPVDCLGHPYGDEEPDCAGNCPGFLTKGDLDQDGEVDADDPLLYADLIIDGVETAAPCVDLNSDGTLSVTDVALAANCAHYGHNHLGDNGIEDHCDWNGNLVVPGQQVDFTLAMMHEDSGFVDLYVQNPQTWLSGWSVQLEGATFTEITPLFDTTGYQHYFHLSAGGMAFGVALEDSLIHKSTLPQPLVRLYFSESTEDICLSASAEVTNEDRHNVSATASGCVSPSGFCLGDANDNGVHDVGDLLIALSVFGCVADCGPADVDADGIVSVNDLLIMLGLFGDPCQ